MPKISFIVSSYQRPKQLLCCLASLSVQTCQDFELIVTDNSFSDTAAYMAEQITKMFRGRYTRTNKPSCYHSAEVGAQELATGEYLCFPSDDSYYVPTFVEQMLKQSLDSFYDFVYCDVLYDPRCGNGKYSVMDTKMKTNHIDKTCFLIRKDVFNSLGFFAKTESGPCTADGALAEMVAEKFSHRKMEEVLVVHN